MHRSVKSGISVLALCVALTGCAETELAMHYAKKLPIPGWGSGSSGNVGGYKIGKPYVINGVVYRPREDFHLDETGVASWYGPGFHGRSTANGERYDQYAMTAAHRTLQMPALVKVTNLENGRTAVLRVNDRGPFKKGRIIDVSKAAADKLGFIGNGTARVRVQVLTEESMKLAAAAKAGQNTTLMADNMIRGGVRTASASLPSVQRVAYAGGSRAPSPAPVARAPRRDPNAAVLVNDAIMVDEPATLTPEERSIFTRAPMGVDPVQANRLPDFDGETGVASGSGYRDDARAEPPPVNLTRQQESITWHDIRRDEGADGGVSHYSGGSQTVYREPRLEDDFSSTYRKPGEFAYMDDAPGHSGELNDGRAMPRDYGTAQPAYGSPTPVYGAQAQKQAQSPSQPAPAAHGIFVQVASFSVYDNAARLSDRLSTIAPAQIEPANVQGRQFYRVKLGPLQSDDQADLVLKQVVHQGHPGARVVVD